MSAVDPLQEVSDLKRKLRLIKNKLLNPSERSLQQAISMIDDTFATEEVQMNCSRFGITCAPPPMFAVPGYPYNFPVSPNPVKNNETPTMIDAHVQTEPSEVSTTTTQTTETGECCAFGKSALYNTTQSNIQKAIDLLTETKSSLSERGKKRKFDGSAAYSLRSRGLSPISSNICNTIQNSSRSVPSTPTVRNVTHLQRVQQLSERKPAANNKLTSSEKLAIEDGEGKYDSREGVMREEGDGRTCNNCRYTAQSELDLFYHECILLPNTTSPFLCCGTSYKHRGYYARHRDAKHKKPFLDL